MNPGLLIVINLVLIGGSLFVYDTITSEDAPATGSPSDYVTIDTPPDTSSAGAFVAEPQLEGLGLKGLMARVDKLERENASMKALLAKAHVARMNADGSIDSSDGEPLAAFELPVVEEGDSPVFEEEFLRSFQAALERVEEQRRKQRTVEGLNRQLDRLGVELSDGQREEVVNTTMNYRDKTRGLWREMRGTDDSSREARTEAFENLREEYSTSIYNLVPSVEAEKIVSGMSRGVGFAGRGDQGSVRGRGRGGNR